MLLLTQFLPYLLLLGNRQSNVIMSMSEKLHMVTLFIELFSAALYNRRC